MQIDVLSVLNGQKTAEDEEFYWSEESERFTTTSKDDYKYPKKPCVFLRDCKYNVNVTISVDKGFFLHTSPSWKSPRK